MNTIKLNKANILLINVLVGLVGLVLVLISINIDSENKSKIRILLEAVGIGLIASGGVNILDKAFTQESNETEINKTIEILDTHRSKVDARIHDNKYTAKKIDIVGINLNI